MSRVLATRRSIDRHVMAGVAIMILLLGAVGGWAATTDIAGAVIASGYLVVETSPKKVQHPTGGVVGDLRVQDGARVRAGDILLRLDETLSRAGLAIVAKGLDELLARKARLEAERDDRDSIAYPGSLLSRASDPDVDHIMQGERRLFEIRAAARSGQRAQLRKRIEQLSEEVAGHSAQEQAKAREIELIETELKGARALWEKTLMPISKLTQLEREATRIAGERGQLVAAIAQVKGKIAETELQIVQIGRDLSSEVGKELRETDGKIGEFQERKIAAEEQLKRIDIRAPQDGRVHQLAVHTVGGVIAAGDVLMLIVPEGEALMVEVRVPPQDIDQVREGQNAVLRFSAFSQRSTPEINGTVRRMSPDITTDQRTGQSYYTLRLDVPPSEKRRLGDVNLVPGMPVEAFIRTGDRKVLSYLVKPLQDQVMRAFRER